MFNYCLIFYKENEVKIKLLLRVNFENIKFIKIYRNLEYI